MKKLKFKRIITELSYSAHDWELLTVDDGVEESAKRLNIAVTEAVNSSDNEDEAFAKGYEALYKERHYGATDTEPRWHLTNILRTVYQ